jgi:hypothetical protein
VKVFLLAHQDDEIFLLPHIMDSEKKLFIFLTNGVSAKASQQKLEYRATEAQNVFKKYLAKFNSSVIWWGLENSIPEGALHKFVNRDNLASIEAAIKNKSERVTKIVTTTFEGAHQDHDSAAVISRRMARAFFVEVIEISTYPQWFSKVYSFKVLRPSNPSKSFEFDRQKTLGIAIKLILGYRSQWKTWLGLGPAAIASYAFLHYRSSKQSPIKEIQPCFYEYRNRATQVEVLQCLTADIEA